MWVVMDRNFEVHLSNGDVIYVSEKTAMKACFLVESLLGGYSMVKIIGVR